MRLSQLSRELQDIMKEQDPSLSADAVDDDVYQWDVLLGGFAPASPLGQVNSSSVLLGLGNSCAGAGMSPGSGSTLCPSPQRSLCAQHWGRGSTQQIS